MSDDRKDKLTRKDIEHYNAILIEDIRDQFKLFAEANDIKFKAIDEKFKDQETYMNTRFDTIESVIKYNSQKLNVLESNVKELKSDLKDTNEKVSNIEKKLANVQTIVIEHDKKIEHLRKA